jgi:hypothetical protein
MLNVGVISASAFSIHPSAFRICFITSTYGHFQS